MPGISQRTLIAAGLAPFAPESAAVQAGRLMLAELERHFHAGKRFAFEITLAGHAYLKHIRKWQATGYRVELIFLQLDHPDEVVARDMRTPVFGGMLSDVFRPWGRSMRRSGS